MERYGRIVGACVVIVLGMFAIPDAAHAMQIFVERPILTGLFQSRPPRKAEQTFSRHSSVSESRAVHYGCRE